jgi:SAM-dependent methyltransferase
MRRVIRGGVVRAFSLIPRGIRRRVIQAMLAAEETTTPAAALPWLLAMHDYVLGVVDTHCIRWGRGVHLKHDVMEGIHSYFCERVPPGARVLDVGCGNGALAHAIAVGTDAHVLGVDMDPAHIAFAQQRFQHPRLRFELRDVTADLPDVSADVVVCSSVLEHLSNRVALLDHLRARFGATRFLIRVPMFEYFYVAAIKKAVGVFAFRDPTHLLEYSPEILARELAEAGLAIRTLDIRWGDLWADCQPLMPATAAADGSTAVAPTSGGESRE